METKGAPGCMSAGHMRQPWEGPTSHNSLRRTWGVALTLEAVRP